MTLREVKPFNTEQWAKIQQMIKNGPTQQSIDTVNRALERVAKLRKI